ncbi:unnamed protein product [Adineta steineri]|uniref:RING-type domain-containing protein n=1 Tax=Adineta steineri TaxID=433720 RepID=A0A815MFN7_9BILA|nr:unnamed protein product [Adineta steineri]CAF1198032.1 unnamed protein product [Adineta steineri]CAF1423698.1 unnamed protein product [Adineta steineri]
MAYNYEYIDESSIDVSLKFLICSDPYTNPCSTVCDHTFCRSCITKWLETSDRCSACSKKPMTNEGLYPTNRVVFDILDRLLVQCKACRQTNIQRGNFDEHSNRYCLKTFTACLAVDLKCPWQGPRDQLTAHLSTCSYEVMRPVLTHLMSTINNLTVRMQQYENQHTDYQNRMDLFENCDCKQLNERMKLMQILSNPTVNSNPRLETILSQCPINSTINLIDLRLNNFDIPFIIRHAIIRKQCLVLNLSNNLIESNGIELLANAIRSNLILKRLCLKGNQIGSIGVDFLAKALMINSTLEVLDLESNNIANLGVQSLAEMVRENRTLKDLHLGYNCIENRGMEVFLNAIDNNKSTIELLSLSGNCLDDKCLDNLEKMIHDNKKLRQLDLYENHFSLEGKTRLLKIGHIKKGFKMNI